MKVPLYRHRFEEDDFTRVMDVIKSGNIGMGKFTEELENRFAEYTGSKFAIAVSSCTTALHLAIEYGKSKIQDKKKNKVIVPAFTWISTANAVLYSGEEVKFCDIELDSFNIDIERAEELVDEEVWGVIPVHQFGNPLDIRRSRLLKSGRVTVIEDAACALNARIRGRHVGNFGETGCFSFHPRKSITSGDGGIIVTNSGKAAEGLKSLRNHGQVFKKGKYKPYNLSEFDKLGYNYRITELQSAILIGQFNREKENYQKRKKTAKVYSEELSGLDLKLPEETDGQHGWQSYVCMQGSEEYSLANLKKLNSERNKLMQYLDSNGIMTRPGTYALHTTKLYKEKYGLKKEDFPNALIAQESSFALPIFAGMEDRETEYVIKTIKKYFKERK